MIISNTRILNNALFDVTEHTYSALERNVSGFLFKNLAFGLEVFVIVFRQVPCVPPTRDCFGNPTFTNLLVADSAMIIIVEFTR